MYSLPIINKHRQLVIADAVQLTVCFCLPTKGLNCTAKGRNHQRFDANASLVLFSRGHFISSAVGAHVACSTPLSTVFSRRLSRSAFLSSIVTGSQVSTVARGSALPAGGVDERSRKQRLSKKYYKFTLL